MFKKILVITAMLFAAASFAAVDANKGSAADFDGLKGVGPALSKRILDARQQGAFKDWDDLMQRVKGVKDKKAAKLSSEGMTVNGESFKGGLAKPDGKRHEPKVAKAAAVTPAASPAVSPAVAPSK